MVQIVSAAGTTVVALAALVANVWTTRRTLGDRREERLWAYRNELYVEIVHIVLRERDLDVEELLLHSLRLPKGKRVRYESRREDEHEWWDYRARVRTYASNSTSDRYDAWDKAVLPLADLVQPIRAAGRTQSGGAQIAVDNALAGVIFTVSRLVEQIRSELGSRGLFSH
jgi:hypothetical protein